MNSQEELVIISEKKKDADTGLTMRLYKSSNFETAVLIPEEYAMKLDDIGEAAVGEVNTQSLIRVLFEAFALLPDHDIVRRIIILTPGATDSRQFASTVTPPHMAHSASCARWGRVEGDEIYLHGEINTAELPSCLLHFWAHILFALHKSERRCFNLACEAEAQSAALNAIPGSMIDQEENFAIQVGLILEADDHTFDLSSSGAPISTSVLARQLKATCTSRSSRQLNSHKQRILQRINRIDDTIRQAAIRDLLQLAKDSGLEASKNVALRLLAHLGSPNDWRTLRGLERLDLSGEVLSDNDLSFLTVLKDLTTLNLSGTAISQHGLQHLQHLSKLTSLKLARTAITNSSIDYLTRMPELESLDLSETLVNDIGISELVQMTSLRQLDLRGTAVTELGLTAFKIKNSVCQITFDSNSDA
jgi:hypothetical protein